MPVKSVNKPRAELLGEVFGGRAWNVEGRTWRLEEVAGEEEQGCWFPAWMAAALGMGMEIPREVQTERSWLWDSINQIIAE